MLRHDSVGKGSAIPGLGKTAGLTDYRVWPKERVHISSRDTEIC